MLLISVSSNLYTWYQVCVNTASNLDADLFFSAFFECQVASSTLQPNLFLQLCMTSCSSNLHAD